MTYYRQVPLDEGQLIQFVGCYVLKWPYETGDPTIGFVPIEDEFEPVVQGLLKAWEFVAVYDTTSAEITRGLIADALDELGFGYLTGGVDNGS